MVIAIHFIAFFITVLAFKQVSAKYRVLDIDS